MTSIKIISVKLVAGHTLNSNWKSDMQKITTDQGVFIDNATGQGPFDSKWIKQGVAAGFDWSAKTGEEVTGVVRRSRGHNWLNKY